MWAGDKWESSSVTEWEQYKKHTKKMTITLIKYAVKPGVLPPQHSKKGTLHAVE